jgi:hypothetical protein
MEKEEYDGIDIHAEIDGINISENVILFSMFTDVDSSLNKSISNYVKLEISSDIEMFKIIDRSGIEKYIVYALEKNKEYETLPDNDRNNLDLGMTVPGLNEKDISVDQAIEIVIDFKHEFPLSEITFSDAYNTSINKYSHYAANFSIISIVMSHYYLETGVTGEELFKKIKCLGMVSAGLKAKSNVIDLVGIYKNTQNKEICQRLMFSSYGLGIDFSLARGLESAMGRFFEESFKKSIISYSSSKKKKEGLKNKSDEYQKYEDIALKYWNNDGQMNHSELTIIIFRLIEKRRNKFKLVVRSIREKLGVIATDFPGRKAGVSGAEDFYYIGLTKHKNTYGVSRFEKTLLGKKLLDFQKCTGIPIDDVGFEEGKDYRILSEDD